MGCDIHLYAEKRIFSHLDDNHVNGKWVSLDKWVERDEFETDTELYKVLEVPYDGGFYTHGRNYNLFTALANVRSGHFMDPVFISEPKGMPADASRMVRRACKFWGTYGHSHSWLTLEELKNFNWASFGTTCDDFRNEVIPKLEAAKRSDMNEDDVRIVFWFDN